MKQAATLRQSAEGLSSSLPPLLADAHQLANSVMLGEHGRRRSGTGDEFWQYRQAGPGDSARNIDWRRSAHSEDTHFVREKEWQAAQTIEIWVDAGHSMRFSSGANVPEKSNRAKLLALSLAVLLIRGGERVGMSGALLQPRTGESHLTRLAEIIDGIEDRNEYGRPDARALTPRSRAAFFSDFLGDTAPIRKALTDAADMGIQGTLTQVLDISEEEFPFDGRTRFMSVGGGIEFETQKAGNLRARYLDRLAARKDELREICRSTGWRFQTHHTNTPPMAALIWLYHALEVAS